MDRGLRGTRSAQVGLVDSFNLILPNLSLSLLAFQGAKSFGEEMSLGHTYTPFLLVCTWSERGKVCVEGSESQHHCNETGSSSWRVLCLPCKPGLETRGLTTKCKGNVADLAS